MKNLQFAGPNENVTLSDMCTIGRLQKLEVLNVDQQSAFGDEALQILGNECWNLRCLSFAACYGVSDTGIACLVNCHRLSDLNISYCHRVSDEGFAKFIHHNMKRLVMRACQGITDSTVSLIAQTCLHLEELDVCGCFAISNTSLYTLQESLLHLRSPDCPSFTLLAGGSSVESDAALRFAAATGATVSLHDLSTPSLSADYDPYLYIPPINATEETENWDDEEEAPSFTIQPGSYLTAEAKAPVDQSGDYLLERAEEFLTADDPALYSDEFSGPEEWDVM